LLQHLEKSLECQAITPIQSGQYATPRLKASQDETEVTYYINAKEGKKVKNEERDIINIAICVECTQYQFHFSS
jgi:hypothetical protein